MKHVLSTTVLLTILLGISCHKDNGPCLTCPPPYTQSILLDTLSIEPAAVVFQVSTRDSTHLGVVQIYRDSVSVFSKTILSIDTTIIDTALLPAHHYRYKAYRITGSTPTDSSAAIVLTTMDTTSHNFTWEIDTLGDGASSHLSDVAIVNDTCVWVVGEINVHDSVGGWKNPPYNIARWDGHSWQLYTLNFTYDYGTGYAQAVAVYAFGPTDVLVSAGASVMHWNGQHWTNLDYLYHSQGNILIGSVYRMWGTSVNDLYGVGLQGSIVHWDGTSWQTIASGTTLDIQDVWGSRNQKTGEWEILAVASDNELNEGNKVLKINSNGAMAIPDTGLPWSLTGIWFSSSQAYYIVGDGIFFERSLNQPWRSLHQGLTTYYTGAVQAAKINDVAIVGAFGVVLHYNGSTWRNYQSETGLTSGSWTAVRIEENLLIAVGENLDKAVILIGRR